MKIFGQFITFALIFVSVSAQAKTITLTVPPPAPIEPYTATFTADATGIFENYGVTLQFSPFVGYASGTLSGGLQVKEIETPSAVTPVESGDVVSWPGIYEFPSGATATWQYTTGDVRLQKDLILSEPARTALPSSTAAEFFPGCASPWFVVGDIDFQIDLSGAVMYADGKPFGIEDATYAARIEVRSATGQEYFTLERPYLETESGEIRFGWIYYDGAAGVCLYCFSAGIWLDGVRFDPTITTNSDTRIFDAELKLGSPNSNYGSGTTVQICGVSGYITRYWGSYDLLSLLVDNGITADQIESVSANIRMYNTSTSATGVTFCVHEAATAHTENTVTWNNATEGTDYGTFFVQSPSPPKWMVVDISAYITALCGEITSSSSTAWQRGIIIKSQNEGTATEYATVNMVENASFKPLLTIEISVFFNPNQMQDKNSFIDGENVVFYDNDICQDYNYKDGRRSKYFTWSGIGSPIACPTVSFTTSSIGSAVAGIAIASLPVSHRSHAIIAIASSPGWTKSATTPLSAAGGGGGYTPAEIAEEVYTDSRAFPKTTALSVIQSVSDQVISTQGIVGGWVADAKTKITDTELYARVASGRLATDTIQWNIVPVTIPQSATQCALLVGRSLHPSSATFAAVVNRADTSAPNAPPVAGYNHEQGTGITYATSAGTVLGVSEERHFLYWNMIDTDAAASYQMTLIEKDSSGNLIHWPGIVIVHESTPVVDTSGFVTSTVFNSGVAKIMNAATNAGYYRAAIASTTLTKTVAPTETWNPKDLNVPYGQQVLVEQRTANGAGGWDVQTFVCDYLNNLSIADAIWPITPGLDLEAAADELGIAGSISIVTAGANIPN